MQLDALDALDALKVLGLLEGDEWRMQEGSSESGGDEKCRVLLDHGGPVPPRAMGP